MIFWKYILETHHWLYVVITTKFKYGGTMRLRIYTIDDFVGVIIFTRGIFWFDIL